MREVIDWRGFEKGWAMTLGCEDQKVPTAGISGGSEPVSDAYGPAVTTPGGFRRIISVWSGAGAFLRRSVSSKSKQYLSFIV